MTVVGLDDTDSRERGMCTTYVAHRVAERLALECANERLEGADERSDRPCAVERLLLVRLNPAVEHKTRGNAALAIHVDSDPDAAFEVAREELAALAERADDDTNPGLVVADADPDAIPDDVIAFARGAVRDHHRIADAEALLDRHGYRAAGWGNGRGRIGALAAVGAWAAFDEWTRERIAYRESDRWGALREVDADSVFTAAESGYPDAWDTVDRGEDETVCVPHTPGPILYGIRGDDSEAVERVADRIESEPVAAGRTFVTNQGTDAHLREGRIGALADGRAYRATGTVATAPETRRGGHVFVTLAGEGSDDGAVEPDTDPTAERVAAVPAEPDTTAGAEPDATASAEPAGAPTGESDGAAIADPTRLECAAFEPTKRFRDRVRALRVGDRVTVCGEVSRGTLKLEKFAVRDLVETERVTPTCPDCDRTMESAGREQGYRCRECETSADGKVDAALERDLEAGWYEVPPCARRHVARPLVRGGFDAPTHPER